MPHGERCGTRLALAGYGVPWPTLAECRIELHTPTMTEPQGTSATTIARGILLAVVVLALVAGLAWFVYSVATANDELDCTAENAERALDGLPEKDCG